MSFTASPNPQPRVRLTPFQEQWVKDDSRFKIAAKSRRVGFTFATTLEIARDCMRRSTRWLIVSRTQDTAKEAIREIATHFKAIQIRERVEDTEMRSADDVRINKFVIEIPSTGSEITALTAHPDAARGFGGNVFLDEHGFHRDSKELWKGAAAAVLRGHRLIVVSTPHYQTGNYYELARRAGLVGGKPPEQRQNGIWSAHWVDIHAAAPELAATGVPPFCDGVPEALQELRELAGDEDTWNQEFCCQFLSAAEMWIALELIAAARSQQAWTTWDPAHDFEGQLFVGADIGRKRDATQIWIMERVGQASYLRGLIPMIRTPFSEQFAQLCKVIEHPKVRRACIDSTGIGMQLAEDLRGKFGMKVEPVTFTREVKENMAVRMRRRMEEKLVKIPEMAPEIERDFRAIKRETTASGNIRFDADRNENSHADIFWAAALAEESADSGVAPAEGGWRPELREESDEYSPVEMEEAPEHASFWAGDRDDRLAQVFGA